MLIFRHEKPAYIGHNAPNEVFKVSFDTSPTDGAPYVCFGGSYVLPLDDAKKLAIAILALPCPIEDDSHKS